MCVSHSCTHSVITDRDRQTDRQVDTETDGTHFPCLSSLPSSSNGHRHSQTDRQMDREVLPTISNFLELFSCLWVAVLVGVVFHGELTECLLDVLLRGSFRNSQQLVVVLVFPRVRGQQ